MKTISVVVGNLDGIKYTMLMDIPKGGEKDAIERALSIKEQLSKGKDDVFIKISDRSIEEILTLYHSWDDFHDKLAGK